MEKLYNFLLELTFKDKKPSKQEIKNAIFRISDIFKNAEDSLPLNYMRDEELLKGYLLYFVPLTLSKIRSLFCELLMHPQVFDKKDIKIVDIGCGPAPAVVAILDVISNYRRQLQYIRYVGIEQEEKAIKVGEKLIKNSSVKGLSLNFNFINASAANIKVYNQLRELNPDIMIFSNSVGELFDKNEISKEDFLSFIRPFTYKNPEFTIIIVEPGTKKASMRLHSLRDELIKDFDFYPYSPCLNDLPCAALKANNWCYEERRWASPEYLKFLSAVGLQINYLKFSYCILRKDKINISDTFEWQGEIVKNTSHLLNEKGKSRLWACWRGELIDMEKLKRDFSEKESWLSIRKGSYFSIDKYKFLSDKKVRIPKDCYIKILHNPD